MARGPYTAERRDRGVISVRPNQDRPNGANRRVMVGFEALGAVRADYLGRNKYVGMCSRNVKTVQCRNMAWSGGLSGEALRLLWAEGILLIPPVAPVVKTNRPSALAQFCDLVYIVA